MDRSFALIFIIVLSPIYLIIILVQLIFQNGKVFFLQYRIGFMNRSFRMVKFRTMVGGSDDAQGGTRITAFGGLLRRTSLDELPQFWNVLWGDMSLVGPRPLPLEYAGLFSIEEEKRHVVRPGITGLAQVNGRHEISWNKKFELDLYYVRHVSVRLDLMILLRTVILLLSLKKDMSASEKPFVGN